MIDVVNVDSLQSRLGYRFNDVELLKQALVHRSLVNESELSDLDSNERLEFLGDAALGLAVAEFLYARFPRIHEGDLTALRASLVNLDALALRAEDLNLAEHVAIGGGDILSRGRSRRTILGRTYEAVLGAIYLDGGIEAVGRVLRPWLEKKALDPGGMRPSADNKSQLQVLVQESLGKPPTYEVTQVTGPDHIRLFEVVVQVNGRVMAMGEGSSVQRAEQQAAGRALEVLREERAAAEQEGKT